MPDKLATAPLPAIAPSPPTSPSSGSDPFPKREAVPLLDPSGASSPSMSLRLFVDWPWNKTPSASQVQRRTTFIALFSLIVLCSYVFYVTQPSLGASYIPLREYAARPPSSPPPSVTRLRNSEGWKASHKGAASWRKPAAAAKQIELDPAEELAAVTSFMAALPENLVPLDIDPTRPIDPQVVLDFDVRSARAREEVAEVVHDVWTRNPVVLFSMTHSSRSREIRDALESLHLHPAPTIFDVDQRGDAAVLRPLLLRLTHAADLPVLLVGGQSVGTVDEVRALAADGSLRRLAEAAGAVVDGRKKNRIRGAW